MPPKLLLADDSVTVQRVIALTFAGEDLEIVAVGDGDEAVKRIAQDRPDIVLADLSMPGRDGYGVAEFVKRSSEHVAQTRVVLLTGAFEPVEELRSRQLGIDGVLAKPFEPQVAIGLVKRLLAQSPRFPSESGVWAEGGNESQEAGASVPAVQAAAAIGDSRVAPDVPGIPPADASQDVTAPPAALDDYFQRLDAALSSAGLEPSRSLRSALNGVTDAPSDVETVVVVAPVPPATATPPQADDPSPRAEREETSAGPAAGARETMTPAAPAVTAAPTLRLVDAFSALLDVEEGRAPDAALTAASEPAAPAATGLDLDALADEVARRVLAQLTDTRVREIVSERVIAIAERLVREEIDRIKAEAS